MDLAARVPTHQNGTTSQSLRRVLRVCNTVLARLEVSCRERCFQLSVCHRIFSHVLNNHPGWQAAVGYGGAG
jgi:hypothetical protein